MPRSRARLSGRARRRSARDAEFEEFLLEEQAASFSASHVAEPSMRFGQGHSSVDPKSGLALYGPLDAEDRPLVRIGVLGTGSTVDAARRWLEQAVHVVRPAATQGNKFPSPILFPPFPGISDSMRCEMRVVCTDVLTDQEVQRIAAIAEFGKRIMAAGGILAERLEVLRDKPARPDVVIVALPKCWEDSCRVAKRGQNRRVRIPLAPGQRKLLRRIRDDEDKGQRLMFDVQSLAGIPDTATVKAQSLHRQLKVHAMRVGIPTQLVWQSTFDGGPGRQDAATISWNLVVGLYYKSGGIPWRVDGLDSSTCYVGITFYRERGARPVMRTSMAQAFSDRADGIVLRGEPFRWEPQAAGRAPHLPQAQARRLLRQVLESYEKATRHSPGRVVVHKTSRYFAEELVGLQEALEGIPHYDLVAIGGSRARFLRLGTEPPVRGTAISLGGGEHLLYTRGYIPFLRAYPGLRVPVPLEIREHHGNGSIRKVCEETMALTKMNWNSADFACSDPITLAFARNVGLILAEMPRDQLPATSYRYYM